MHMIYSLVVKNKPPLKLILRDIKTEERIDMSYMNYPGAMLLKTEPLSMADVRQQAIEKLYGLLSDCNLIHIVEPSSDGDIDSFLPIAEVEMVSGFRLIHEDDPNWKLGYIKGHTSHIVMST
jgi:hypothetical protein